MNVVFHSAQTGKHWLRTQNVSEQNQKHFCVRNKCFARVLAIMCPRLPGPLWGALYHILNEMLPLRFDLDNENLLW